MSTLVMTVGTGRNRQDIADALLFSIRQHRPEKTVFLCSRITADQTLPLLIEPMKRDAIPFEVFISDMENDVQALYNEYLRTLRQYSGIIADFTSGTKAMSAALFAAAIAVQADQVSYILGPRDQTGRVAKSTEISAFCPDLVLAERQLDRAKMLFNELDFNAAAALAGRYYKTLPKDSPLRARAKTIVLISQAYDLWERFSWKESSHLLSKAANPKEGLADVDLSRLEANAQFTQTLANSPYGHERLFELYANAGRRLAQGRYDDALSRLYRAYEYLVQNRLKNGFDVDTSKLIAEQIANLPLSCKTRCRLRKKAKESRNLLKLGLAEAIGLLAELRDQVGVALFEMYWGRPFRRGLSPNPKEHHGPLQNWLNQRNRSFLAHGTDPAKEETVRSMLKMYEELLRKSMVPETFDRLSQDSVFITM